MPNSLAGRRVGVVGLGLLGASIAMRARAQGARVVGLDDDAGHAAYARANGIVDATAATLSALLDEVDALVLAVPVAAIAAILRELAREHAAAAARLAWITDVGSTKAEIVAAGADLPNFIGSHPLAGSERRGPQAGRRDLFAEKPWICTPRAGEAVRPEVEEFVAAMGARLHVMDAGAHDHVVARSSHLPQVLSTVLAARLHEEELYGLVGTGLRSMTRLAASPFSVWESILIGNRAEIVAAIGETIAELRRFSADLERCDAEALAGYFARAHGTANMLERE